MIGIAATIVASLSVGAAVGYLGARLAFGRERAALRREMAMLRLGHGGERLVTGGWSFRVKSPYVHAIAPDGTEWYGQHNKKGILSSEHWLRSTGEYAPCDEQDVVMRAFMAWQAAKAMQGGGPHAEE